MKSSNREHSGEESGLYTEILEGEFQDPPKKEKKKLVGGAASDANHAQYSMLMPEFPISVEAQRRQGNMDQQQEVQWEDEEEMWDQAAQGSLLYSMTGLRGVASAVTDKDNNFDHQDT